MGTIKDLSNNEALEKFKNMIDDINVCMFCTNAVNNLFETRPMATQKVDDEGNIWFLSNTESHKNREIEVDETVKLIYAKPSQAEYLTVEGKATVYTDKEKISEIWTDFAKAWFKGGKDDPNLSAICVKPDKTYYWDTKFGKMVTLITAAVGTLTNKVVDAGVEGKLAV